MCEVDVLSSLQPYFPDGVRVGDFDRVEELHNRFKTDFFENNVVVNGELVKVKPYKYCNSTKDGLPVKYEDFYEKFVHIITRTIKSSSRKISPKIRAFDEKRANRIHWIRPILENCSDKRITQFKYTESNGTEREYFWYRQKQYIVVLEHIAPDYTLITGFCVDAENQSYYQNKFINRNK